MHLESVTARAPVTQPTLGLINRRAGLVWIITMFFWFSLLFSGLQLSASTDPTLLLSETQTPVDMATGELERTHYPARRAAQVALHYMNVQHGSPFRVFGLQEVHRASAEDVATGGRKYSLEFSATDWTRPGSVLQCSALVFFPRTERHSAPDVQLNCEDLQHISNSPEESDFYQKHTADDSPAVSAHDIPDSYGNVSQDMKPFWHLARVASSVIMLRESSENTLYNMAQVANVTQQETSEKQLMLNFHVLLHDFVSQEIIHWKLLSSWSPHGGVRVLQTQFLPKCPHVTKPPSGTED